GPVVRAHHRCCTSLHDSSAKGGRVRLTFVAFACSSVKAMALRLRPRMDSVVLRSCYHFQILRIVTLQSFNECHTESTCQIRVFAISLLSSSPARVTKNIDVWRPERETVKTVVVTASLSLVVLGPSFVRDHIGDAIHELRIECRS